MNIDRYCEPSGNGWRYRFPNGYKPSVAVDHRANLRFEIYLGSADNGHEVIRRLGGQSGLLLGLTTEQAEAKLTQIALLPMFDPGDPNPVVLAEPSAFAGQPPVLTRRDGSEQYGPYATT
jgi:hypothetical protein